LLFLSISFFILFFRLSIPVGFTYYTIRLKIWVPDLGDQASNQRFSSQVKAIEAEKKLVSSYLNKYFPKKKEVPDWKHEWNKMVKCSFLSLSNLDLIKMTQTLITKMTNNQAQNN